MNAMGTQNQKSPGSTKFTKARIQAGSSPADATPIWLKTCESPTRFYLERLEGKPINTTLPAARTKWKHSPSRLRRMQKPRGIRSSITECIRWMLSFRVMPMFAF